MGSSGLELQHNKGTEILSKIVIVVVIGLLTMFSALLLVLFFPQIALWLPEYLGYSTT